MSESEYEWEGGGGRSGKGGGVSGRKEAGKEKAEASQ